MKTRNLINMLVIMALLALIMASSCKKDEEEQSASVQMEKTTDVTENSVVIHWSTTATAIKIVTVKVALDENFQDIQQEINVADPNAKSQLVEGLKGASYYYVKVILELIEGALVESDIEAVKTGYQDEPVNLTAQDGLNITGRIKYLESNTERKPAIVFMHQLQAPGNSWNGSETERKCVAEGWVCLVINFRGHFSSDDWPFPTNLQEVYDFVGACAYDMKAAVEFLRDDPKVNPEKIALLGASLGANETLEGNCLDGVVTSVALTPSMVLKNEICAGVPLKSVFYIVGEFNVPLPPEPNYPQDTQALYDNTQEPKKLLMLPLADHGWELLNDDIENQIVAWLDTRFSE
jgi:dienelactone hydrolase